MDKKPNIINDYDISDQEADVVFSIETVGQGCHVSHHIGQIGHKWDKSGTFQDQIQYILARCPDSQICSILGKSDQI